MLLAISALPLKNHRRRIDRAASLTDRRCAAAVMAVAAATLVGCWSKDCIDMVCGPPMVEVQFQPAITQAGHYLLSFDVDGVRSSCEIDFRPDGGWSGASKCASLLLRGGVSRDLATEIVGYGLPEASNVSISVVRDGQLWTEHSFEPRYRGVELFGEGCGECVVATEIVALP